MIIKTTVPASSANIGSGVDCLGIALALYLTVTFEPSAKQEICFGRGFDSPLEDNNNLVLSGARRIFERLDQPFLPLRITIESDIPLSRGLGSSSSAIVAGMLGANELLGAKLSLDEIICEASVLEGHPDNIVPCAVGGFTVAMPYDGRVFYSKSEISGLHFVVAVPEFQLSTRDARRVLPKSFELADVLRQLQRACFLVCAMKDHDFSALSQATDDLLFTPARRPLIPGYPDVVSGALSSGALCSMISGAGPSVIAFCEGQCREAADAMIGGFEKNGIPAKAFILSADNTGARTARID